MSIARILAALAGLALAASIYWAGFVMDSPLATGFAAVTAEPWGWVTLIDLYVGFILFAIIIALVEKKWWVAALWIAPLPFLGNIVAALWLVVRASLLVRERISQH
jgi:hypothetical protein